MSNHERLIEEVLKNPRTEKDHAARHEIIALRREIKQLESPSKRKAKKDEK